MSLLPATDRNHNLKPIVLVQKGFVMLTFGHNFSISLDRDPFVGIPELINKCP
jgi:hypothetical protein